MFRQRRGLVLPFMDFINQTGSIPSRVFVDEESMPVRGLMELLAAARLLGDTDCLGGGGKNAGFVIMQDSETKRKEAVVVKIDTGFSFNFGGEENKLVRSLSKLEGPLSVFSSNNRLNDTRDIQIGNNSGIIQWKSMSKEHQECYIKTIRDMMAKLEGGLYHERLKDQQEKFNKYGIILNTSSVQKIKEQLKASCQINKDVYSEEMKQYSDVDAQPKDISSKGEKSPENCTTFQLLQQLNRSLPSRPLKKTTLLSEGACSKIYNTDYSSRVICKEMKHNSQAGFESELQFFKSGLSQSVYPSTAFHKLG